MNEDEDEDQIESGPKCRCGESVDYENWHTCPFKSEIHNDESECNCCSECRYQCAQDI